MNQPKVSVVVPIYNVEPYLKECVDSLLAQTLEDIEILLIDDGSPDRCGEIADEYARKDSRITAIHQKNAGLGPARNTGIAHAIGEYVGFVDSDDWVNPMMFERLYAAALRCHADIVVGGHRDMVRGKVRRTYQHPLAGQVLKGADQIMPVRNRLFGHLPEDKEVEAFPMRVWTTIYRNAFLRENEIRFEEILSEDTIFNLSAYKYAGVIAFTYDTDYCYRAEDHSSIAKTFSSKKLAQHEEFVNALGRLAGNERFQYEQCLMRVKRTAIEYCRIYAGLVVNSGLSLEDKRKYLHELSKSKMCTEKCEGYPVSTLPRQQRIFQKALSQSKEWEVFILVQLRRLLKIIWN